MISILTVAHFVLISSVLPVAILLRNQVRTDLRSLVGSLDSRRVDLTDMSISDAKPSCRIRASGIFVLEIVILARIFCWGVGSSSGVIAISWWPLLLATSPLRRCKSALELPSLKRPIRPLCTFSPRRARQSRAGTWVGRSPGHSLF
jgi:hypothetical protein